MHPINPNHYDECEFHLAALLNIGQINGGTYIVLGRGLGLTADLRGSPLGTVMIMRPVFEGQSAEDGLVGNSEVGLTQAVWNEFFILNKRISARDAGDARGTEDLACCGLERDSCCSSDSQNNLL